VSCGLTRWWSMPPRGPRPSRPCRLTWRVTGSRLDTGFWIFGKKRMIPAGVITRIDHDDRNVYVTLTKDQIKQAPDFDETRREQEAYRKELADYYGGARTR